VPLLFARLTLNIVAVKAPFSPHCLCSKSGFPNARLEAMAGQTVGTYAPLDETQKEIRLCTLSLQLSNGLIQGNLRKVSLLDGPIYNALSYCWGDANDVRTMLLDGIIVKITANLESALRCIVHSHQSVGQVDIWIDAICINQEDAPEKNHQVPLMRYIYTRAASVLIWLGNDIFLDKPVYLFQEAATKLPPELNTGEEFQAAEDLLKNCLQVVSQAWFHRTWTVQEFVLPPSSPIFLCGSYAWEVEPLNQIARWFLYRDEEHDFVGKSETTIPIRTNRLFNITNYIEDHRNPDPVELHNLMVQWTEALQNFTDLVSLRKSHGDGRLPSLQNALSFTRLRKVTDPRDKIYALIGLLPDSERNEVVVDYDEPVPLVYCQAMRSTWKIWKFHKTVLQYSFTGSQGCDGRVPSWIPDFSEGPSLTMGGKNSFDKEPMYVKADRPFLSPVAIDMTLDQSRILITGVFLDSVSVCERFDKSCMETPEILLRKIRQIFQLKNSATAVTKTFIDFGKTVNSPEEIEYPWQLFLPQIDHSPDWTEGLGDNWEIQEFLEYNLKDDLAKYIFAALGTSGGISEKVLTTCLSLAISQRPEYVLETNKILALVMFLWDVKQYSLDMTFFITQSSMLLAKSRGEVSQGDVIIFPHGWGSPLVIKPQGRMTTDPWYTIVGLAFLERVWKTEELEKHREEGILVDEVYQIG
jgi:hypothetical protein